MEQKTIAQSLEYNFVHIIALVKDNKNEKYNIPITLSGKYFQYETINKVYTDEEKVKKALDKFLNKLSNTTFRSSNYCGVDIKQKFTYKKYYYIKYNEDFYCKVYLNIGDNEYNFTDCSGTYAKNNVNIDYRTGITLDYDELRTVNCKNELMIWINFKYIIYSMLDEKEFEINEIEKEQEELEKKEKEKLLKEKENKELFDIKKENERLKKLLTNLS